MGTERRQAKPAPSLILFPCMKTSCKRKPPTTAPAAGGHDHRAPPRSPPFSPQCDSGWAHKHSPALFSVILNYHKGRSTRAIPPLEEILYPSGGEDTQTLLSGTVNNGGASVLREGLENTQASLPQPCRPAPRSLSPGWDGPATTSWTTLLSIDRVSGSYKN